MNPELIPQLAECAGFWAQEFGRTPTNPANAEAARVYRQLSRLLTDESEALAWIEHTRDQRTHREGVGQ